MCLCSGGEMGKALVILSRLTRPTNGVCGGAAAVTQSRPSGRAIVQHLIHKEDQRAADCCFLLSLGTSSPTHSVIGAITYVVCIYLKEERRMDLIDVVLSLESESKLLEFMNCISSIRAFLKYSVFVLFSLCGLTRSHVLIVFVFLRNVT